MLTAGYAAVAAVAAVASTALGLGAAAQEKPLVLGVWVPAAHAVPDPLPLTEAARRTLAGAVEPAAAEPAAAELAAAAEPAAAEPSAPCPAPGMPALLDTRGAVEITQERDRIRMSYAEWSGAAPRTIYMNPRNGPPTQEPSPLGVSFGRWESQALAIFTTYIAYPYFDRAGRTPQSAAVTVLERYTPSADGTRLEWKVTVSDAATFTRPVVMTGSMRSQAGATRAPEGATPPGAATAEALVAGACVG